MSAPARRAGPGGRRIVVPVKELGRAKSRLAEALGEAERRRLVLAMTTDTLASCLACPGVSSVLVVTPDPDVAALSRGLGADVVAEPTGRHGGGTGTDSLNDSLRAALPSGEAVGVVSADLPALHPEVLAEILAAAHRHRHSVVVDHLGTGTTMAFWDGRTHRPEPRFGPDSAARFRRSGAVVLPEPAAGRWAGARQDVDVPADLRAVALLGTGTATRAVLAEDGGPRPHAPDPAVRR